ncbi:MBL fold metallo-hydrolase [Barnesiella propionica]|uniref:MBL fold metallo-hydrolase n=1 Tax=Barnesiella propionica TaxID=2981781 RepID=UPI0011C9F86D|nr:MBL fold metallo-hydrolase [Barnesiella propionica]
MGKTKYRIMKLSIISVTIIVGIFTYTNLLKGQDMIEYRMNPDLDCIKPDWKGNIVINGKFQNDTMPESAPLWDVVKWKLSRNPQRKEKKSEIYHLPVEKLSFPLDSNNQIIWLGHATFIIQINGVRIITDPVFENIPANKRKTVLPCNADSIGDIDYLLISHDHHDHFNKKSIELLSRNNPSMEALTPLNARRLFDTDILKNIPIQEAGWYQEYRIKDDVRIIFLPAKHWGRRGLNDFNKTLWGGFLIVGKHTKVFFAGDSAYGEIFKDIQELFGDIDICIFPIGAYSPEFMMASSHMNPEEAITAFRDLNGKIFIPMHYGTFDLSDEPLGEPIRRLRVSALESNCMENIKELTIGHTSLIE